MTVLGRFLSALERAGRSAHTLRAYASDVRTLADRLGHDVDEELCRGVRVSDVRAFVGAAPAREARARRLTAMRRFFRWARSVGFCSEDPTADLEHEPIPRPVREALSRTQLGAYLSNVQRTGTPRDFALVALLAATGVLAHELLALDLADVDLRRGTVDVQGRRRRAVSLGADAVTALRAWVAARGAYGGPLFTSANGLRLEARSLGRILRRYELDAPVTPRVLRGTFVALQRARGVALDELARALGHAATSVTALNDVARWRAPVGRRRGIRRGPPRERRVLSPPTSSRRSPCASRLPRPGSPRDT